MSNRIIITIPSVNIPEVKYVFNCLISQFLGLQYDIVVSDKICDYRITFNSQSFEIANVFFRDDNIENLYQLHSIPSNVTLTELKIGKIILPQVSMFGNPYLITKKMGYYWENDIIAATFYMLSRWEEKVILRRDEHDRFSAKDSLAYKNNFLLRPIVNEYVEILYQILLSFGLDQKRKVRKYKIVATHDVDRPYLWSSQYGKAKSIGASLLLRRNMEEIKLRAQNLFSGKDPFDTFDMLMDMSEAIGEKAHFFIMSGGVTKYENYYQLNDKAVIRLIQMIKERNHIIGIHPSYNTYRNFKLLNSEITELKKAVGSEITVSRQHYLRFDVNSTWSNLERSTVKWDSSMCYADSLGFRSGVCYSYPVFDIQQRQQLSLRERPLIVMDTTLLKYEKLNIEESIIRVVKLQEEVSRYNGDFVFLWHNSSFNSAEWIGYNEVFKSMYKQY